MNIVIGAVEDRYTHRNWLQKVYVDLDWTQTRIAEECDVSARTIGNWITKYGIQKNRHEPEWLEDKYVKEHLSQRQIGELCDTGSSTIGDQLRKYGIERERTYRDRAWLQQRYDDDGLTIHEIADSVEVGDYAIRYWLVKHGIERRGAAFPVGDHPIDYDETRLSKWADRVKARDRHACVACSSSHHLHAHHIVPRYEDQSEEMVYGVENGETLCRACHAKRHRERGDEQIAKLIRHTPH